MTAILVGVTPVKLAAPGNRDFIHIFNNGSANIYLCYDGSEGVSGVNLTTATGIPVVPNGSFALENTGPRQLFTKSVWAISGTPGQDIRLQGV